MTQIMDANIVKPKIIQTKRGETNCGYGLVPDWSTYIQIEFAAHGATWDPRSSHGSISTFVRLGLSCLFVRLHIKPFCGMEPIDLFL